MHKIQVFLVYNKCTLMINIHTGWVWMTRTQGSKQIEARPKKDSHIYTW